MKWKWGIPFAVTFSGIALYPSLPFLSVCFQQKVHQEALCHLLICWFVFKWNHVVGIVSWAEVTWPPGITPLFSVKTFKLQPWIEPLKTVKQKVLPSQLNEISSVVECVWHDFFLSSFVLFASFPPSQGKRKRVFNLQHLPEDLSLPVWADSLPLLITIDSSVGLTSIML